MVARTAAGAAKNDIEAVSLGIGVEVCESAHNGL